MRYYPIFVDLEDRTVLIVGGGEEALRKARLVAKTPARIHVVAEELSPEFASLPRVTWAGMAFAPDMLEGVALVYVADQSWADQVSRMAQARTIPINVVDEAGLSTFLTPSIVDRDPVVVAIGTEGAAPVLGQGLRARIDSLLPSSLGPLAIRAQGLRDLVGRALPHGAPRRSFWSRFFFGSLADRFHAGDETRFAADVTAALKAEATPAGGRVSYVGVGHGEPELLTLKAQRRLMEADIIAHDGTQPSFLEMARRDAMRLEAPSFAEVAAAASRGERVVRLVADCDFLAAEQAKLTSLGITVEVVESVACPETWPASAFGFPSRTDIETQILRAAS